MKVLVCIPARYESTRFAGKVLANETGKYLIQHTYEQALKAKSPDKILIATDHQKVMDAAQSFGARCVMTSPDCASGTDRIAQAIKKAYSVQGTGYSKNTKPEAIRYTLNADDIIVNLQADEPEIDPANIDAVAQLLIDNPESQMATLAAPFQTAEQIKDPNIVKVVTSIEHRASSIAIYFSRSVIPYDRQAAGVGPIENYLRHLGIYAYRKDFLEKFTKLPQGKLENIEKLEQLRAIENGYPILVAKVQHTCAGIDTKEQYEQFVKRYKEKT